MDDIAVHHEHSNGDAVARLEANGRYRGWAQVESGAALDAHVADIFKRHCVFLEIADATLLDRRSRYPSAERAKLWKVLCRVLPSLLGGRSLRIVNAKRDCASPLRVSFVEQRLNNV
jgi:hypothetical protein